MICLKGGGGGEGGHTNQDATLSTKAESKMTLELGWVQVKSGSTIDSFGSNLNPN